MRGGGGGGVEFACMGIYCIFFLQKKFYCKSQSAIAIN